MAKQYHSMSTLEYRLLNGSWQGEDNPVLYLQLVADCEAEGWIDFAGNVTQKGKVAKSLYEVFRRDNPEDDDLPWEGDSVLYLDHYRLADKKPLALPAPEKVQEPANDRVIAAVAPSYLAAPEDVEARV